jgi:hypothetical protein
MLEGAAMTAPFKINYQNSRRPFDATATCALGAARHARAVQTDNKGYLDTDFYQAELDVIQLYFVKYKINIFKDNDKHGRDYAISKVKEAISSVESL